MKKQVILISQVFYPDEVAVSNLFTKLLAQLVECHDIEVTVWCAQPSYSTREKQPRFKEYKGIKIFYLKSTNFPKESFMGRLVNMLTFSISVIFKLIMNRKRFPIITHTTPPFLAILVAFFANIKRIELIYVLMDIFPDGLIQLGKVSRRNPFIRLWKRWHKGAFSRSRKLIVIGRDMHVWLTNEFPDAAEKIYYIPLWQDEKLLSPIPFEENPFVISHHLKENFEIQFSGNMGLWNDLDTVGKVVKTNLPGVHFTFIGGGIRKNELMNAVGTKNPSNATFLPFVSNNEYASSVTACHCGLVTLREDALGMAVPSKIIGILAAGTPVLAIAPKNSELAFIVNEERCGFVVDPGDVDGLVYAINYLKEHEQERKQMGLNGRKAFEKKYTTAKAAESYAKLI